MILKTSQELCLSEKIRNVINTGLFFQTGHKLKTGSSIPFKIITSLSKFNVFTNEGKVHGLGRTVDRTILDFSSFNHS
jgi:hypothetical protein